MKIHVSKWTVLILVLTLLGLARVPGEALAEEKEVIFLSLSDYTGPIAGLAVHGDGGCEDYFKYLNDKGGVDGVKIKFIGIDTRYDVAKAISAYRKYRKTPRVLVINGYSTGAGKAIEPMAKKDGVIILTPGDGEFAARISQIFLWGQCYQDAFGASLDWMVKDWQGKGKSGMPTVGYIHWDNPLGREPLRGGKEYAQKIGVKLLEPEFIPPATPDHTTYLTRLKDANYIYVGGCDPTPTNVIRDAYRLGMCQKIQFVCDYWGPTMNVGVKAHQKELQRVVKITFFLDGTDALAHPLIQEVWVKYRKKAISEMTPIYGLGMVFAMTYEAGLRIALKDVGYDKLSAEAMYQAYQKLTGKDVSHGIQGLCTYSPTSRRASKEVRFYQVTGEKMVPVTGWIQPPDTVSLHKF
jgi:ABC-type branched-subunit amino acid transport system substrate-binding protein